MNIFQDLSRLCPTDDDDEIAIRYQQEPENRNVYVARIYCKYFSYITSWYSNKEYFNVADLESWFLEVVHTSLMNYNPKERGSYKTLLSVYMKNRIRYENECLFSKSRSWYLRTTFASGNTDNGESEGNELLTILAGGKEDDRPFEVFDILESVRLSENQRKYCNYVLSCGYTPTDTEVSKELGISKSGVRVIKEYLRERLGDYFK